VQRLQAGRSSSHLTLRILHERCVNLRSAELRAGEGLPATAWSSYLQVVQPVLTLGLHCLMHRLWRPATDALVSRLVEDTSGGIATTSTLHSREVLRSKVPDSRPVPEGGIAGFKNRMLDDGAGHNVPSRDATSAYRRL
jgi:hypothetical protein